MRMHLQVGPGAESNQPSAVRRIEAKIRTKRAAVALGVLLVALLAGGVAKANVPLTQVSADPFTNATSQHATEVEPDTFAFGSTVVSTFQVGRFFNGGATDIGFVRSGDGGATWGAPGFLPGMTFSSGASGSPFERVSDPSVAYDAAHATWLISSIPLLPNTVVPTVFVNRSTDDGRTWSTPVSIPPPVSNSVNLDKNWTVCDNGGSSRFRGHCYTELDNFGDGDRELMSTSTDGGQTWSTPIQTAGHDKGLGGQPVVQPNGQGDRSLREPGRKDRLLLLGRWRRLVGPGGQGGEHPLPRRRRRPAYESASHGRGCR